MARTGHNHLLGVHRRGLLFFCAESAHVWEPSGARAGALVLEDGAVFPGVRTGHPGEAGGEVVFTTSMTGYQEILSDPSYRGQIVVMSYPLIGNYGFSPQAWEAAGPHVAGFVVRESSPVASHHLSRDLLGGFLNEHGVPGLAEVDTRRLVRHLRTSGLKRGVIVDGVVGDTATPKAVQRALAVPPMDAVDLVGQVSRAEPQLLPGPGPRIAIIDCGVKAGIVDALRRRGCEVVLLPHTAGRDVVDAFRPGGVVVSNGPGDPAVLTGTIAAVRALLGTYPLMGICLGHQLLALASGGRTYKMKFGHRGSNQPVLERSSGAVMVTTQNHGYAVDPAQPGEALEVTHVNLNDGTVEGLRHRQVSAFSVQFHPEGRPGPTDADVLYDRFLALVMEASRAATR